MVTPFLVVVVALFFVVEAITLAFFVVIADFLVVPDGFFVVATKLAFLVVTDGLTVTFFVVTACRAILRCISSGFDSDSMHCKGVP